MSAEVVLCADSASLQHPECIGLDDEAIEGQGWLSIFSDANLARSTLRNLPGHREVWVAGSDQVGAMNLAAALKNDRADSTICLVAFQGNGSLFSRASAAGIDQVLDRGAFVSRYGACKLASERRRGVPGVASEQSRPASASVSVGASAPASVATSVGAALPTCVASAAPSSVSSYAVHPPHVSPPVTAERVRSSFETRVQNAEHSDAYVLAVVGAGGGVGKSAVAALSACFAQGMGHKTLLVDADLQFGDMHYMLGCEKALRIDEAMTSSARLEALKPSGRMPALLAAPRKLENSEQVQTRVASLIAQVKQRFDVIVVNTGPAWDELHMQLLEACNNTLFVIDQRPSSVRACRHALDLCSRCGIASQPFLFALNRCSRNALFSSIDVSCALRGAHVMEMQDGGSDVEELLGAGQPLDLIDSHNPFCVSLEHLLTEALPENEKEGAGVVPPLRANKKRHMPIIGGKRKKAACL